VRCVWRWRVRITTDCNKSTLLYRPHLVSHATRLPKKDETATTIKNSLNMTIPSLNYVLCIYNSILLAYLMIWQRKKQVYSRKENHEFQETEKLTTVVSEVSSFVGNPVYLSSYKIFPSPY